MRISEVMEGELPRDLNGIYLGDGMVHAIRVQESGTHATWVSEADLAKHGVPAMD